MNSFLRKANIGVDFRTLAGAFVRDTILPHDVDCMIEVGGQFLILECKQDGENMSSGQQRSLQMLAREPNKKIWEVRLSGKTSECGAHLFDPVSIRRIHSVSLGDWQDANLERVRAYCKNWSSK